MVYFTRIEPTHHYLEEHQHDVPWHVVVEVIFKTKNPRKKGNKYEIKNDYYILFEIREKTAYVINAKKAR